jgi:hypothetical protein
MIDANAVIDTLINNLTLLIESGSQSETLLSEIENSLLKIESFFRQLDISTTQQHYFN